MSLYDRVAQSFQKFFNHQELQKEFDLKANTSDVRKLLADKPSTEELQGVLRTTELLSERLKQVAMV